MKEVNEGNFEEKVLMSDKPVLVMFSAEWCGPCRMEEPILEEFQEEHPEIELFKLNVDHSPHLAGHYEILAVPVLQIFVKGVGLKQVIGAMPKRRLLEEFDKWLAKP